ncbi:MAG: lysophospholipid acyltransferase family protein [Nitrospira sp.]|nr:lysophospholipid acyltransferase family protein [Nitrospira sp.]MDH4341650.1 lysophospholipid acyltransferase family protein [Nitrospira sp.]MDH5335604.1 lysophospholipid acyltransferase family protein [Nitrospira sp.]
MKKSFLVRWLKLSVLPPVGAALIRGIARTMRHETRGQEAVDALYREGGHAITAFWHAQQLMIPFGYRGPGAHVLISQHGDGEIIARIIARFGHGAVRGSSTRGGANALRALIKLARSGQDVAVTPDGPKGPRHVAKLGVIQLAKASGLPIVPIAFACSKKNSLRVGIATWSPIRFRQASFATDVRSGSHVRPMRRRSKQLAWNLRPC